MDEITVFNTHCCGEIGDVVTGIKGLKFNSPEEASKKLLLDKISHFEKSCSIQKSKSRKRKKRIYEK